MQEFGNFYPQLASPVHPQLARPALKVAQVLPAVTPGKPLGHTWHWGFVQDATTIENFGQEAISCIKLKNHFTFLGSLKVLTCA